MVVRPRPTCYNKALDLLSRRGHFRKELQFKLRRRDYEEEEVEAALQKLADRGFLDDGTLARDYVEGRLRRRPMGRLRLIAELRERGVDDLAIDEALAEYSEEKESELAAEAAAAWRRKRAGKPEALARHLASRGFPSYLIAELVHDFRSG